FYIETGNASEAYRRAYDAENMKPETVNRRAFDLMENSKIKARIEALRAEHRKEHNITVSDILNKLEDIYSEAMKKGNLSSAVSAVMGQAKVLGFDKQTINLEGDIKPLPTVINVTFSDEPQEENFFANSTISGVRAIVPSSFVISQITPASLNPARRAKSTEASVCPRRVSTPPFAARSGKT
ncbi:terminase small subunit family protein, partial [Haemophilus influenzae HK1212]